MKLPVFKKKKYAYLYKHFVSKYRETQFQSLNESKNSKIFLGWHKSSDPQNEIGANHTCSPTPRFAWILPKMQ